MSRIVGETQQAPRSGPAKAIAFYTQALGFTTHKWDGPMDYTMLKSGDETFGGVVTLPTEAAAMGSPPHWLGYVGVDDLNASVAKAAALGGKVLKGVTTIPNAGQFAVLRDPTGGTFALFQSASPSGKELECIAWTELMSTDVEAALRFYGALFGWEPTESMDMGDHGRYQMFGRSGKSLGGMMKSPMGMSAWAFYFGVDGCAARMEKASGLGAKPIMGPMDVPGGGKAAMMFDPTGAAFALFSS